MTPRARLACAFGLVAMLPAALIGGGPARAHTITAITCSGRTIELPLPSRPGAPGQGDTPCCAKACHTGQSRKRGGLCH